MAAITIQQAFDLAWQHHQAGRLREAKQLYRQVLARQPQHINALHFLGVIAHQEGENDIAVDLLRKAIALAPDYVDAHSNLGTALKETGELDEAITAYRKAIALKPDSAEAHSNLIYALHYHPGYDAKAIADELRRWNQRHAEPLAKFIPPHTNDRSPDRRLRIGYVSPDFTKHVVGRNLLPLLREHDRRHFEITCYAQVPRPDAMTSEFRKTADRWRSIVGLSDEEVAQQIRDDGIDILVDLTLHTANNRLLVFARKPAPVQVTYLAYCGTSGMGTMDYRFSDPYMDPDGTDFSLYSEKTIRLPKTYWCYRPPPATTLAPAPALAKSLVTFGCLNNFAKVSSAALDLWAKILAAIPNSRIIIHAPAGAHVNQVAQHMESAGVPASRLSLVGKKPVDEYLQTYSEIDIALDPFPYGGGITTCDALWMGVPVVTLSGKTAVGRGGWSILSNLGLTELIAFTPDQYVQIAVDLARDMGRINDLRMGMRARMLASPLLDATAFARDVEAAYRQMWRAWCNPASDSSRQPAANTIHATAQPAVQQIFDLALQHHQAGRLQEAENLYGQILAQQPEHADAMHLLGVLALQAGRNDIAVDLIRQAIAHQPSNPEALVNLGNALKAKGQLDEAIAAYRQAITLRPNFPEAHNNLGIALKREGKTEEAIVAYRQAIALRPSYAEVFYNLAIALREGGQLDDAIAAGRQTVALNPGRPEALTNLANALRDIGQLDEAIAAYRRAIALRAGCAEAQSGLLLTLHYHPDLGAGVIAQEHRNWNQQISEPSKVFIQPHANDHNPERRLRIGYVSPDFREHPVARFLLPLLANHDHHSVEVFAYSQVRVPDEMTGRFRKHTDAWRSLLGLSDVQAAEQIRRDQIDILVDLAGHTADHRLFTFARKPAPVQVTYLGYPDTTGLGTMDYRLTDSYADPPGQTELYHSEQLIRLDPCAWCFGAPTGPPLPQRCAGPITFGCFNNAAKVTLPMLDLWSQILLAVPESRLLLKSAGLGSATLRQEVQQRLNNRGIASERLELRGPESDYSAHLALYGRMDIALDTFPYHGTTTTCEALWMAVPVLSLAGSTHVSRVGVSLLNNVGLPELVAGTPQEYVRLAANLANDLPRLRQLHSTLRGRMEQSPLMNAKRLVRSIEDAYRGTWRRWCAQNCISPISTT